MPATSPTAPTRSWRSTTCATASRSAEPRHVAPAARRRAARAAARSRRTAAARPAFRHRRRGRQRADRRGAHAADHLRPTGAGGRRRGSTAQALDDRAPPASAGVDFGYRGGHARCELTRARHADGRPSCAERCDGIWRIRRARERADRAGAVGAAPVPARRALPRGRRQGADRRRIHRPRDARPVLGAGLHQLIEVKERRATTSAQRRRSRGSPTSGSSAATCVSAGMTRHRERGRARAAAPSTACAVVAHPDQPAVPRRRMPAAHVRRGRDAQVAGRDRDARPQLSATGRAGADRHALGGGVRAASARC